tara:strand:+ start:383 stop:691 length:309 start_codon:yes stop_codon:yes gene_type:complete
MNAAVRKQMYQALPRGCYIDYSSIAGQGLFTRLPLVVGAELGMSHLIIGEEIIRTPLGGFINHSDTPNCEKYKIGDRYYIKTIKPIRPQQELTLRYTFYSVG